MLGEITLGIAQAAEVDDALNPNSPGSLTEIERRLVVSLVEGFATSHAVDQVVGSGRAAQRRLESLRSQNIGLDHFDLVEPRAPAEARSVAHHHAHAVAGLQQPRHQPAADIAGGAGDGDKRCLAHSEPCVAGGDSGWRRTRPAIHRPSPNKPARTKTAT